MARCPFAQWHGDGVTNETKGQMRAHKGLVLHIEQGSNHGTDSWFHNPQAQVSAHFGVGKDGSVFQWVDTDDTAWAEMAGNHYWISVENEGYSGQPLTQAQEESVAKLFAWAAKLYHFPFQVTADPTGTGLGHHAMGGSDWGGHTQCPGEPVVQQKPYIVNRARQLADAPAPTPKPAPKPPAPQHPMPTWYHRVLRFTAGSPMESGEDVKVVQRKVGATADGLYGPNTAAKVRGFQLTHKLAVDGVVGPLTAKELGA